jgi:hypothetical protein
MRASAYTPSNGARRRGILGRVQTLGDMNVPVSKLVGVGDGAPESRGGTGARERSSGSSSSEADGARRQSREPMPIAEGDLAHRVDAMLAGASLAPSPTGSAQGERFHPSARLPAGSLPPAAGSASPRPRLDPVRFSRGNYLAGGLALAALAAAAFALGRLRASSELAQSSAREPDPTQQTRSGLQPPPAAEAEPAEPIITPRARDLPLIPFVPVEVEPAHAEIWLDRELVGRGRLQLGAVHDGMMHELRFVAPGHETTLLFFRGAPPAGRVILKRIAEHDNDENLAASSDVASAVSEAQRARADEASADDESGKAEAEPDAPTRRARRTVAPAPARARLADDPPAASTTPKTEARKPPQVQLIEVHTPRVQVLD